MSHFTIHQFSVHNILGNLLLQCVTGEAEVRIYTQRPGGVSTFIQASYLCSKHSVLHQITLAKFIHIVTHSLSLYIPIQSRCPGRISGRFHVTSTSSPISTSLTSNRNAIPVTPSARNRGLMSPCTAPSSINNSQLDHRWLGHWNKRVFPVAIGLHSREVFKPYIRRYIIYATTYLSPVHMYNNTHI